MCVRCEELQEQVQQLKAELSGTKRFPAKWSLTPAQKTVLGLLVTRGRVTYQSARIVLWDEPPDSDEDVIRRHISVIRVKLPWLKIETIYGEGWELAPGEKEKIEQEMVQ